MTALLLVDFHSGLKWQYRGCETGSSAILYRVRNSDEIFVMATYMQVKCLMKSQVAQLNEDFSFMSLTLYLYKHTPLTLSMYSTIIYDLLYRCILFNFSSRPVLLYHSIILCSH